MTIVWILIAILSVGSATYAWFTFNPYTNITPMTSSISEGDVSLLISLTQDGGFDTECALPQKVSGNFEPISTADLNRFYSAIAQNRDGISTLYKDSTDQLAEYAIHGQLYLKCSSSCDVYLYRPGMDFGTDAQTLAALRLGMKLKTQNGTNTFIFPLDEMGNTQGAVLTQTIPQSGMVVAGIDAGGKADYVSDPARSLSDCFAVVRGENDTLPGAGVTPLCTLIAGEVAEVEYWLYLEGCDDQCSNEVQNKDIYIQLAFAGVTAER